MLVFAYGSLCDPRSRAKTIGADAAPPQKATLLRTWGHERAYNVRGDREVYMGLRPGRRADVHGLVLTVTPAQFAQLRARERYYHPVPVPRHHLHPRPATDPVTFYPLPQHALAKPGVPSRRYAALVP